MPRQHQDYEARAESSLAGSRARSLPSTGDGAGEAGADEPALAPAHIWRDGRIYRVTYLPEAKRPVDWDSRKDASYTCGCAWNDERCVTLGTTPDWEWGVKARGPSEDCVACQGSGSLRDRPHAPKPESDPVAREFLRAGGSHIPSGQRVKIRRNVQPVEEAALALILWVEREKVDVERDGIRAKNGKRNQSGKWLLGGILDADRSVNVKRLAEVSGIDRGSLRRWKKKCTTLRTNSRGTKDMSTTLTIHERIDALEERLIAIQQDTRDTVERLRDRFPNNQEVSRAVDNFLGDALSEREAAAERYYASLRQRAQE